MVISWDLMVMSWDLVGYKGSMLLDMFHLLNGAK